VLDRAVSTEILLKYVEDYNGRPSAEDPGLCESIAGYCGDLPKALFFAGDLMKSPPYVGAGGRQVLAEHLKDESARIGRLRGIGLVMSLSYRNLDSAARHLFRMSCTTRATSITGRELAFCLDVKPASATRNLGRLVRRRGTLPGSP
jgi:hypothetical protein